MRIDCLAQIDSLERRRIQARVRWEEVDRPPYDLFFEVDRRFGKALALGPHPFLVGCVIPALHFGERRLAIEGDVCAELLDNVGEAQRILSQWYSPGQPRSLSIEPEGVFDHRMDKRGRRRGVFFSGGIDSYAVLRLNRLRFPGAHPRSFKDGVLVFGLEQDDPGKFDLTVQALGPAAEQAGLSLLPVYTNIYLPFRGEDSTKGFELWGKKLGGSALAAVGHALTNRLWGVSIGASQDLATLEPWGTHPLLDPLFGSSDMEVRHEGLSFSRVERTRLVAGWKPALRCLRVCNKYRTYSRSALNCGACEKCVRTMLTLLSMDALKDTDAFPVKDVTPEMIHRHVYIHRDPGELIPGYQEIIPGLERIGRTDLVAAIRRSIIRARLKVVRRLLGRFASACLARAGNAKLETTSKIRETGTARKGQPRSVEGASSVVTGEAGAKQRPAFKREFDERFRHAG
jgi:hypothetical protein